MQALQSLQAERTRLAAQQAGDLRSRQQLMNAPYLSLTGRGPLQISTPPAAQLSLFSSNQDNIPSPEPGPPPDYGQQTPEPSPTPQPNQTQGAPGYSKYGMIDPGVAIAQQIMEKRNKDLREWGQTAATAPALGLPVPPAPNWSGKASSGTAGKHNSGTGAAADIGVIVAQQFEANKNQYGINIDALLKAAESQLNTKEGANNDNPYGTWYKDPNKEWCAQFASWCANQIGCLNTDISKSSKGIPKNEGTGHFAEDYKKMNRLADGYQYTNDIKNAYKPKAGDYVFFGWGHTGIVVAFDEANGYVYTIEGNTAGNNGGNGNGVYYKRRSYKNGDIKGYGINGGTSYGTIPNLSKNSE